MDCQKFGKFISEERKRQGLTQAELAKKLSVTNKAVSRWETALGYPDITTLEPLADALGVTLVELMRSERTAEESSGQDAERAADEAVAAALEIAEMKRGLREFTAAAVAISAVGLILIALAVFLPSAATVWTIPFVFCVTAGLICLAEAVRNRLRERPSLLWFAASGVLLIVPLIQLIILFALALM